MEAYRVKGECTISQRADEGIQHTAEEEERMNKIACLCCVLAAVVLSRAGLGWAEVKPGDTITKENMALGGNLLTPATHWMVEQGMPIQVIETKPVRWPQAYSQATEQYAGQVKLAEDGRDLINYVAGCPFPKIDINDPMAGFKVMWNREQSPAIIDNLGANVLLEFVSSTGAIERTMEFPWRRLMWTGRLYTDPKPVIPHSPAIRHTNLFGPYTLPHDFTGLMVLDIRYLERDRPDDTYAYLPEWRRVRRLSEANRSLHCPVRGFDFDSFYGFNGNMHHWTFRVLAEKTILGVVHSGKYGDRDVWCAPRDGTHGIVAALPCVSWEKRKVWVIEATPTNYPREYAYSKRILYIDQDFFRPLAQEMYDHNGELAEAMLLSTFYAKKPYAGYPARPLEGAKYNYTDEWPFTPNWVMVNIKDGNAITYDIPSGYKEPGEWYQEWYFNEDVPNNRPESHSLGNLIATFR